MKLLLDSHTLFWWLNEPGSISDAARRAIRAPRSEVFVSTASIWELAIKAGLGKISVPDLFEDVVGVLDHESFGELLIRSDHARHHRRNLFTDETRRNP